VTPVPIKTLLAYHSYPEFLLLSGINVITEPRLKGTQLVRRVAEKSAFAEGFTVTLTCWLLTHEELVEFITYVTTSGVDDVLVKTSLIEPEPVEAALIIPGMAGRVQVLVEPATSVVIL
jgi:hypothetical protein